MPLDAKGRWQPGQLVRALAGETLTAVYSSDWQRAAAAAQSMAGRLGLTVLHDSRLRERDPDFGPPSGERPADFYDCRVAAVRHAAARHAAARHPGQAILVVAHGGALDCL